MKRFPEYQQVWMVVYLNPETGLPLPCYDCGLWRTREEAEKQRLEKHDSHGIPTKVVELYPREQSSVPSTPPDNNKTSSTSTTGQ